MEKYWALDYVDETSCELVVGDKLYATEEEAYAARARHSHPECYEVNWYSRKDLEDNVYGVEVHIDKNLKVHPYEG